MTQISSPGGEPKILRNTELELVCSFTEFCFACLYVHTWTRNVCHPSAPGSSQYFLQFSSVSTYLCPQACAHSSSSLTSLKHVTPLTAPHPCILLPFALYSWNPFPICRVQWCTPICAIILCKHTLWLLFLLRSEKNKGIKEEKTPAIIFCSLFLLSTVNLK